MTTDIEAFLDMHKEEPDEPRSEAERYLDKFFSRPQTPQASNASDYYHTNCKCIEILTYAKELALAASAEARHRPK
ncbi:MAG: hypothetical protein FWE41_08520 [Coriobacteriia bacterium]|nr:hypothetical protein [Coriobacteriia bacterium]